MIAWTRTHVALTLTLLTVAAVAVGLGVLYAGADEARREAWEPEPIPTIDPYPTAPMDLAPELDTTNDLENTDAVRTIRATYAGWNWAKITNNTGFAQHSLYNRLSGFDWIVEENRDTTPSARLGPIAFVPMSITTAPDGTVTVEICTTDGTGAPGYDFDRGKVFTTEVGDLRHSNVILSPLTETERARLAAYDTSDLTLVMRTTDVNNGTTVDCTGVTAVQQVFTHWEEHLWK